MQGVFFAKKTKCQSICYGKYIEIKLVIGTNSLRYQKGPMNSHADYIRCQIVNIEASSQMLGVN